MAEDVSVLAMFYLETRQTAGATSIHGLSVSTTRRIALRVATTDDIVHQMSQEFRGFSKSQSNTYSVLFRVQCVLGSYKLRNAKPWID